MRTALLATTLAVLLAPPAFAADPPVVFQTQPVGRVLGDIRTAVGVIAGPEAVQSFNDSIKQTLGEKGFEGLDLNQPVVGYVDVPAEPKNSILVVVLPITGEKEFLAFFERFTKLAPTAKGDGLYEVPSKNPDVKVGLRVSAGYAYLASGASDPARVLEPKALVPSANLYNPADPSLASAKVYFDRLPKEVREKVLTAIEDAKKALNQQAPGLGAPEKAIVKAGEDLVKLATRYLDLSKGAKEAAVRLSLDPATADLGVEFGLTAAPGTPLDTAIAARKPTANKFAGVITPDTVNGFYTRLPLFNEELRSSAVEGLEELRRQAANNAPPQPKALLDELLKGMIRTAKTGEADVAAALRGPDKDGVFTGVAAVAFEDPSAVEKVLKKVIDAEAPPDFKDALKWDAEKVGGVSVHTLDLSKTFLGKDRETGLLFGNKAVLAFAFAPKAVYGAMGPDAVTALKGVMALKPAEAPVLDVVLNASRVVKMVQAMEPQAAAAVAKSLGTDDKLFSAVRLSVAGGKELGVKFGMSLRLFGQVYLGRGASAPAAPGPNR